MKLLLITPYGANSGGISKWASNVLSELTINPPKDLEIKILQMNRSFDASLFKSRLQRLYYGVKDYMLMYNSFRETIKNNKFDVVHLNSSASYGLFRDYLFLKYLNKCKIKSVIHFHFGRIPDLKKSNSWEWKMIKKIIKMTDNVILMDKMSYSILKEENFTNISLLANPYDPKLDTIISKYNITRIKGRIFYAGHCLKTKGIFELVKACKEIKDINLVLAGTISDDIKQILYDLGGENSHTWLHIKGNQTFEEVIKEMLSCDIFVLPSYSEGFPNVILEAMACQCAIIATKVGAIPEMLDFENEKCGILVNPKDVLELKNAIVSLLNNPQKKLYIGKIAKEKVDKEYNSRIITNKLYSIWKRTLIDLKS